MSKGSAYEREINRRIRPVIQEQKRRNREIKKKLAAEAAYRDKIFGTQADVEAAVARANDTPENKRWLRRQEKNAQSDDPKKRAKAVAELKRDRELQTIKVLEQNITPEYEKIKKEYDAYQESKRKDGFGNTSEKTRKLREKFSDHAFRAREAIRHTEHQYGVELGGPARRIVWMEGNVTNGG